MSGTFIYLPPGGGGESPYWGQAVATFAALPGSGEITGEVVAVLDTISLYMWDGATWQLIVDGTADVHGPASSVDNELVLFNGTTGKVIKSATGTGYAKATSGVASFQAVPIPVADGGTNSTTALSNNRVMQSSGGAIVEAAAITASRALASDANGIPVASATTATELGYVSGVTSAIQTQLGTKVTGPASATDNAIARYDNTTGKLVKDSAVTIDNNGGMTFTGTTGFLKLPVLTTTQRDALTPSAGLVIFNSTTNRPEFYIGAPDNTWLSLGWGV